MPFVDLRWAVDVPYFLIERYDRFKDERGFIKRLHQEDFCQALGIVSEMKYQNEGGPNLAQCFDLVRRVTKPSAPHILRLLDGVIFNALIGNHDAHGKNFSLLCTAKGPVLAPFYDLLSTAVYPKLSTKMSMKIGDKYKYTEVTAKHWGQFADLAGLSKPQTKKRIIQITNMLANKARDLQADEQQGFKKHHLVEEIIQLIEQRCALTQTRLTGADASN